MKPIRYIVFSLLLICAVPAMRQKQITAARHAAERMRKKGILQTEALAKQFLDKECVIFTISDALEICAALSVK